MANKYHLSKLIESIAPLESAESWDMSGWLIETTQTNVDKILLCLTITNEIMQQAKEHSCDMIISHHPLFYVPLYFNCGIDLYCAHTNLDKAFCGTTETLINTLKLPINRDIEHDFLRFCDVELTLNELLNMLKPISNNIRFSNPQNTQTIKRIAFCSGSGSEFWHDAEDQNADVLITGDLKFHTALDSKIPIIDIGHYESETLVLDVLQGILPKDITIIKAKEKSPITQINS